MKILATQGREDIAVVYIAENENGQRVEFVQSLEPPIPASEKWVNIISTLFGCPVQCPVCDAGLQYKGKLNREEMLFQVDYLVQQRFGSNKVPSKKWKIQFARMGEPAFNPAVIEVLETLPERYVAEGLLPSVSTVAPSSCEKFFDGLLSVKKDLYPSRFQFQFSIHSTDPIARRKLIPVKTWDFKQMATYGERIFDGSGRKVTLNFALLQDMPADADDLRRWFDPDAFLVKVTPANPTQRMVEHGLRSLFDNKTLWRRTIERFQQVGFQVIESIGELEENQIGSNCGQFLSAVENGRCNIANAYTYNLIENESA